MSVFGRICSCDRMLRNTCGHATMLAHQNESGLARFEHSCLIMLTGVIRVYWRRCLSRAARGQGLSLSLSRSLALNLSLDILLTLRIPLRLFYSTPTPYLVTLTFSFRRLCGLALSCCARHAINCEQHIASSSGFIDGASVFHLSVLPCCRLSLLCCALPLPLRVLQELPGITALSDA